MEGHVSDLNLLLKKYRAQVESLQEQLSEASKNLNVVSEAIELLKREGGFGQQRLFETPNPISDRYKDMSMTGAIEDILRQNKPHKLSAEEIYSELVKNGFKSDSKDLKRDLYVRLYKMNKGGKIVTTKKVKGKLKKYFLLSGEGETKEEEKKE